MVGRRQEGQGQERIRLGLRKGGTVAAAEDQALAMVAVVIDELAHEEEGGAEDLATAVKIAKDKDPPNIFIDLVKIKQSQQQSF